MQSKLLEIIDRRGPHLVLGGVIAAYLLIAWSGPRFMRDSPSVDVYLFRPLLWVGVAALALLVWSRSQGRRTVDRFLVLVGVGAGVVHVAVFGIAGLVAGFGRSSTAVSLPNLPLHTWFLAAGLAGAEVARPVLLEFWSRRSRDLAFVGVTLLFFMVATPPSQFGVLGEFDRAIRIVGGLWIPAFAISAVATWMCSVGGLGPSFAYRAVLAAYAAFLPILPSLGWLGQLVTGLVGAGGAALFVSAVTRAEAAEVSEGWSRRRDVHPAITVGAVALALALALGVFGLRTMTITGISMEPTYNRGDVVFVWERFDPAGLEPGDVVVYDLGRLTVAHRIVAKSDEAIVTQGDNVLRADRPISSGDVSGRVVGKIPWAGYPILWITGR